MTFKKMTAEEKTAFDKGYTEEDYNKAMADYFGVDLSKLGLDSED